MSALTRLQREFLSKFFARPSGKAFYLTGGVALSEYYLQHRLSLDLDLFTSRGSASNRPESWTQISQIHADFLSAKSA